MINNLPSQLRLGLKALKLKALVRYPHMPLWSAKV